MLRGGAVSRPIEARIPNWVMSRGNYRGDWGGGERQVDEESVAIPTRPRLYPRFPSGFGVEIVLLPTAKIRWGP